MSDPIGSEFFPLESINAFELTGSTLDNTQFIKKFHLEIKEAMDHVMGKTAVMIDQKMASVLHERDEYRSAQEQGFQARINELRKEML